MRVETILEPEHEDGTPKNIWKEDSVFLRTLRLTLNLLANILIILTVFVCLLYAWPSEKANAFQLHIILCVIGYQFFMCHGILVISKFNSWSMFIPRRHRRNIHWILQVLGVIFVIAGSIVILKGNPFHFNTCHGLCALIMSCLGSLNGLLVYSDHYAFKFFSFTNAMWTKQIHYTTGIGTLLLSAACLCLGFEKDSFRSWAGSNSTIVLEVTTSVFTILVALDFLLSSGRKMRGCCN